MDTKKLETCENVIRTVITFLAENEQYGDDWAEEIGVLEDLLDYVKQL